ncbi:hypothetical protein RRG08_021813 [Elysia crispata]|uniref:Uncharacterized protein n=1 Tax=Elysia crispata TaxID=231223 RepID=A0AAE1DQ66_9GAST|nr:hypothetical protein RRG08_021813 [Elysia crispata]
METIIIRRRWRWIGHVLRKKQDAIPRVAVQWRPEGHRKRGRPKTTWRRTVEAEAAAMEQSWGTLRMLAQDREQWKEFVAALIAHGKKGSNCPRHVSPIGERIRTSLLSFRRPGWPTSPSCDGSARLVSYLFAFQGKPSLSCCFFEHGLFLPLHCMAVLIPLVKASAAILRWESNTTWATSGIDREDRTHADSIPYLPCLSGAMCG